jgi:peptidoglycan-N-acetylglucosamine deacetylase
MIPTYFHKTPFWLRKVYPSLTWRMNGNEKVIYLTFDDGPIPELTPYVLDTLQQVGVKATFFCVGENIKKNPSIFEQIINDGHSIGNHTYNHLNGWKHSTDEYVDNVEKTTELIQQYLPDWQLIMRPPYGKITKAQIKKLAAYNIYMWDVLSGDFDFSLNADKCLAESIKASEAGSIVVFHDNNKASERIQTALPRYIDHFLAQGFSFLPL